MESQILILPELLHFVIAAIGAGVPIAKGNTNVHQHTSSYQATWPP
jgi:hypothetical protein